MSQELGSSIYCVYSTVLHVAPPHPHPQLITVNEWQQLSRRTLSATLPARERERERTEKRDSAVARALTEITAVLFSSAASCYLVYFASGLGFFSSTHPLDPPRGNLYCVVVTQRLLLHKKERIEERERERSWDRPNRFHWYWRERQQKKGGEAVAAFFLYFDFKKKKKADLYGVPLKH